MRGEYSVLSVGGMEPKRNENGQFETRILGVSLNGDRNLGFHSASRLKSELADYFSNGKYGYTGPHALDMRGYEGMDASGLSAVILFRRLDSGVYVPDGEGGLIFRRFDRGPYATGSSSLLADGEGVIRLLEISHLLSELDVYTDPECMKSGLKLTVENVGAYLKA
jgi:hypothetical protein